MKFYLLLAVLIVATPSLTGCFDGDDDTPPPPDAVDPPPPPPPPPPTGDGSPDEFGAGFATAFQAGPDGQPVDPIDGDIIAINLFANPTDIPNP